MDVKLKRRIAKVRRDIRKGTDLIVGSFVEIGKMLRERKHLIDDRRMDPVTWVMQQDFFHGASGDQVRKKIRVAHLLVWDWRWAGAMRKHEVTETHCASAERFLLDGGVEQADKTLSKEALEVASRSSTKQFDRWLKNRRLQAAGTYEGVLVDRDIHIRVDFCGKDKAVVSRARVMISQAAGCAVSNGDAIISILSDKLDECERKMKRRRSG